jgi:hypothetical protein
MPNLTANYGLKKPLSEEFYDVDIQNENMDIIDEALGKCASIPVTDEVPEDSSIWIDPDDTSIEESHVTDTNNPHKVTREQIGAAPSGYGFGESAIQLSNSLLNNDAELETVLEAIYSTMKSAETKVIRFAGYPSNSDYVSFGFLFKSSANNGSFVAYSAFARGTSMTKTKYGGAWQPLEWNNPPMELGKEYRTTERWQGKAVYTKSVSVGNLPNATTKTIENVVTDGFSDLVDLTYSIYAGATKRITDSRVSMNISASGGIASLVITATENVSGYAGFVTLKYTKD